MRAKSWIPVATSAVAAAAIVTGVTAAAHASLASPLKDSPTVGQAAAATPTTGADPEQPAAGQTRQSISAPTAGGLMTDSSGMTVYTFSNDKQGVSTCTDACAVTWVPVRSHGGKPKPGTGFPASALGSIQRPDGGQQVTVYGLPLYFYAGDSAPGDAKGQGLTAFGGTWSADPPPAPPTTSAAPASPTK